MSPWAEYYKNRVGSSYTEYCKRRYAPMIEELEQEGTMYLEQGCGIGTISKILLTKRTNIFVHLTDKDKDVLDLAVSNLEQPKVWERNDFLIEKENILRSLHGRQYDVIFSHGVLEHFSDIHIKAILKNQKEAGSKIVHYVPTNGYDAPSFGDERLLPKEYWIKKFKPTRYTTFNENKDLLLIWE